MNKNKLTNNLSAHCAQEQTRRPVTIIGRPISKKTTSNLNKKAALGPQTMVFVYFFILVIIAAGIVWGVLSFFTANYDFREVDASLLTEKIVNCLSDKKIEFQNAEQFESEFYEKCKINKEVIDQSFFIFIKFSDDKIFEAGPGDKTQCELAEKNINYPKCKSTTLGEIEIETGSNQKSRKIKTT